jgi:hypothetical protein
MLILAFFVIACGLFEWKKTSENYLLFVYICIGVGDPIIKRGGGLGSRSPV